jgi:hypothetical protein
LPPRGARRSSELKAQKIRQAREVIEKAGPPFAQYFTYWLKEHASRRCAPKTLERYRDLGKLLAPE